MMERSFVAAANHLLAGAQWATERLRVHAGKQASVHAGAWVARFRIAESGLLAPGDPAGTDDVTVEIPSTALARWFLDRTAASRSAAVSGDVALAEAISFVAANIEWDFEEDLSRLTGDIAAHRVGEAVRGFRQWRGQVRQSAEANIAEYLTEEKGVLPTRLQAEAFLQAVDELRDAAERLAKRIERLEQRQRS
jgi:ubiquinone biosynthesis protein UbiJ